VVFAYGDRISEPEFLELKNRQNEFIIMLF